MANAASPLIYLDSMVFIYAIEGRDETLRQSLFGLLRQHPRATVTSELTLAEVFAPTVARGRISDQLRRVYLDLIVWSNFIQLEAVTRSILLETADARVVAKLKLLDPIHLVTAIRAGCRFFMTADAGIRTPESMRRIGPDADGIDQVAAALAT